MTGPLLTIDEAAARLRKPSGRWLWDWLRQHAQPVDEPPYFLQAGRDRLFSQRDLDKSKPGCGRKQYAAQTHQAA